MGCKQSKVKDDEKAVEYVDYVSKTCNITAYFNLKHNYMIYADKI